MNILELKGCWTGAVSDPKRRFLGTVATSDFPTLEVGSAIEIHFETERSRVQSAGVSGVYVLHSGKHRLTLAGLTCKEAAMGGKKTQDDTVAALWTAQVIA